MTAPIPVDTSRRQSTSQPVEVRGQGASIPRMYSMHFFLQNTDDTGYRPSVRRIRWVTGSSYVPPPGQRSPSTTGQFESGSTTDRGVQEETWVTGTGIRAVRGKRPTGNAGEYARSASVAGQPDRSPKVVQAVGQTRRRRFTLISSGGAKSAMSRGVLERDRYE